MREAPQIESKAEALLTARCEVYRIRVTVFSAAFLRIVVDSSRLAAMARRRRNRDAELIELLMSVGGAFLLLYWFSPAFRQAIIPLGFIAICLLTLALIVGIGFLLYRLVVRKRRLNEQAAPLKAFNLNRMEPEVIVSPPSTPKLKVEVPGPDRAEMKAPDLLEQLKKID